MGGGGFSNQGVTEEGDLFQIDRDGGAAWEAWRPSNAGTKNRRRWYLSESRTSLLGSEARRPGSTSAIFTISEHQLLRGN